MTTLHEIATALQLPADSTEKKVWTRAINLKITPFCSRCGGSGQYSFNQIHGSTCYGCNGRGHVIPNIDQYNAVLMEARAAAEDGRLDAYLEQCRARSRSRKAMDRLFARWKEVSAKNPYRWQDSYGDDADPDAMARFEMNAIMSAAHDEFRKVDMRFSGKGPHDWCIYEEAFNEAMAEIDRAETLVDEYNAKQQCAA